MPADQAAVNITKQMASFTVLPATRYAVASALAASAVPSLVLARGHRIEQVPEIPLVVDDGAQTLTKTRKALDLLQRLGAGPGEQDAGKNLCLSWSVQSSSKAVIAQRGISHDNTSPLYCARRPNMCSRP